MQKINILVLKLRIFIVSFEPIFCNEIQTSTWKCDNFTIILRKIRSSIASKTKFPEAVYHQSEAALQRCSYKKVFWKICSKFTGEHPCQSVISIKLQSNFIEIVLRHGCSPVFLLYVFRTPFPKNTSGWLLLKKYICEDMASAAYVINSVKTC